MPGVYLTDLGFKSLSISVKLKVKLSLYRPKEALKDAEGCDSQNF